MSDDDPDMAEAVTRAAQMASIHVARAARELWRGAAVFVEEISKAFDDDGDDDAGGAEKVPVEDE